MIPDSTSPIQDTLSMSSKTVCRWHGSDFWSLFHGRAQRKATNMIQISTVLSGFAMADRAHADPSEDSWLQGCKGSAALV